MQWVTDAPKTKSINIVYHACKSTILCLIILQTLKSFSQQQSPNPAQYSDCQQYSLQLNSIQYIIFICALIMDIVSLIFFYCTDIFSRLQFYVFYICHIILIICMFLLFIGHSDSTPITTQELIGNFVENHDLLSQNVCHFYHNINGMLIMINLLFISLSLIIMPLNLYFGQKFSCVGSNIFWTYAYLLLLTLQPDKNIPIIIKFIAIIHCCLTVTSIIVLILTLIVGKTTKMAIIWKVCIFISFVCMLLCYLVSILQSLNQNMSPWQKFYIQIYKLYGPLEIISPLLFLIFVQVSWRDPRQKTIKYYQDIFLRTRQHEGFSFGQVG